MLNSHPTELTIPSVDSTVLPRYKVSDFEVLPDASRTSENAEPVEAEPLAGISISGRIWHLAYDVVEEGKRSEVFHHLVGECKEAGLTQGQTVTLVSSWCARNGKYVGREASAVATSWPKLDGPNTISAPSDSAPLDWQSLFSADLDAIDWELEPICEKGQLVALVAPAKTGKSLLVLEWCARMVGLGRRVLYLDFENTTRDIVRRLRDMAYGPADLTNLVYLSFPAMGPLDTETGARDLANLTATHKPDVLIIDTWSRVIKGKENDSDPVKEAYRLSLLPLKSSGITVFRLDHTGKDISRGSRGTSAKNDDVDHEWTLIKKSESHFLLERTHTRTGIGQDKIDLRRTTGPLRHEFLFPDVAVSVDVQLAIKRLDELGIPANVGRTRAAEKLRESGYAVRTSVLAEAVRYRKEQMQTCSQVREQVTES